MDRSSRSSRESTTPADPLCPDPEVLAAWVDQGLEAADRARIDTHLVGCDDCRLVVARVIEFQHAMAEEAGDPAGAAGAPAEPARDSVPRTAAVLPFTPRTNRWRVAALVTAAAAVLLLAVQVLPVWGPGGGAGADSRLADLADAVGQTRTVEARLTGGFRYGPLRAPLRSGGSAVPMDNWTLYAAAGKIREEALQDPTAQNLHALGLAHLVLGNYDDAVQALEDAIAEAPKNGRFQSDLAAAYLARAKHLDRPDDLPKALAAAERALGSEDRLEARFNRALALQSLYLEDQARQAWDEYLTRDNTSDWAEDARRHLAALQRSASVRNDLARNNSPPAVSDTTVEAGLDWILRRGLPDWAGAVLASDHASATRHHATLREYAQQIVSTSGDPFAALLTTLPSSGEPTATARATAIREFTRALALIDDDNLQEAEKPLVAACPQLGVPQSWLCDLELATLDVLHRHDAAARERGARVARGSLASGALYTQARVARLEGYRALFSGAYAAALREYKRAYDLARQGKYGVQAGVMAAQMSSVYDVIGLPLDGWRWRAVALEATTLPGSRSVRYLANAAAASALASDANHEAARAFLAPAIDGEGHSRLQSLPMLLSQARFALGNGDTAAASESLEAASRIIAASSDFRAARMQSEVLALEASVAAARRDLPAANRAMDAALTAMGPERSARRAAVLLERARIHAEAGSDLDGAQRDLDEATVVLQSRGIEGAQPLPAEAARLAFEASASLVGAKPALQGSGGLALSENLRLLLTGVLPGAPTVTAESVDQMAAALQPGTTAVVFLFGSKGLLSWTLSDGRVHFEQLPVTREEIERRVAALSVQLARTPLREDAWRGILAELYDSLLGQAPGIREASAIVIVPDGPLRRVPFGSLVDRRAGMFLFEKASVRVVPSLVYGLTRPPARSADASLLAIGEPEVVDGAAAGFDALPNARAEAIQVATLYRKSSTLIGRHATKDALLARLPEADVLHFAGHALGGRSGVPPRLLLAGGVKDPASALSLNDLKDRLRGARIVLAACETAAAARTDRSVGAADLAGAFLRGGAASVVATLWKIDDVGGQEFFVKVHRGLAMGQPPAVAVAAAQRACRASESCRSHPVTWVGTTVYGVE